MTGKYENTPEDKLFRKHMVNWFYSFSSEVVTKEMEVDSLKKLERRFTSSPQKKKGDHGK